MGVILAKLLHPEPAMLWWMSLLRFDESTRNELGFCDELTKLAKLEFEQRSGSSLLMLSTVGVYYSTKINNNIIQIYLTT